VLHLLHPALVHFSVAFLIAGGTCEAWGIFGRRAGLERFGATLIVAGTLSLLPTIVAGLLAKNSIVVAPDAAGDLELHERLGFTLAAVLLLSQFWKAWRGGRLHGSERAGYVALVLLGLGLVVAVAWVGAEMVYEHGVGTAGPGT
jgi:uncharacterized membrane protein